MGADLHIDKRLLGLRLVFALFLENGFVQNLAIQVVSYCVDIAVLLRTEKVACAAYFQVAQSNLEACSEFCKLAYCLKSSLSNLGEALSGAIGEVGVCLALASSHSASELMKLGKSEFICVLDNQRISAGEVYTGFDDSCADENVQFASYEELPHVLKLILIHLSVGKCHAGVGNFGLYRVGYKFYGFYLVV